MKNVIPHILYIVFVAGGVGFALAREGFTASFMANFSWSLFNIGVFIPYIIAARQGEREITEKTATGDGIATA